MRMRSVCFVLGSAVAAAACTSYGKPLASPSTAGQGTVTGDFVRVGGPAPGAAVALTGSIRFMSGSRSVTVPVAQNGKFTVRLPAGRYEVKGTSPQIQGGVTSCSRPVVLTVISGQTVQQQLVCDIR